MEQEQSQTTLLTDHAMLVVWGQFAHCLGLIQAIEQISLSQKTVDHSPQGKVLEFLVAILGGLEYLSLSPSHRSKSALTLPLWWSGSFRIVW